MLPSTLECNCKLNFMTHNSNSVNENYELKTQYFMSQIIKITCPAVGTHFLWYSSFLVVAVKMKQKQKNVCLYLLDIRLISQCWHD